MSLKPLNNRSLIGYNDFFSYLKRLFDTDQLPNKIIFSGYNGIGKSTLSYHLVNYIFSLKESYKYDFKNNQINEENNSFKLILNKTHPNFFFISNNDESSSGQISKVRELISFTNKSSFNNECKIILIDNIEYMNINATNALLKLIEEPNKKIYFFLIHNNNKKVTNTLQSRCIKFNMFIDHNVKINIIKNIINCDFYDNLNLDFKNIYNSPGEIFSLYYFFKENDINENITIDDFLKLIINKNYFKKNLFIKNNLTNFIELFFIKKFNNFKYKNKIYNLYKYFNSRMHDAKKYNLDIESVLIEFNRKFINE